MIWQWSWGESEAVDSVFDRGGRGLAAGECSVVKDLLSEALCE